QFADWLKRYNNSNAATRSMLTAEGVRLAAARREELKSLIQSAPAQALTLSIAAEDRRDLPDVVAQLLEDQVAGTGNFEVRCVLPLRAESGAEHKEAAFTRSVTLNGQTLTAHVFGAMAQMPSLQNVALAGIAVDDQMAVANYFGGPMLAYGDASVGSSAVVGRPVTNWTTSPKRMLVIRVDFPDLPGEPVYVYNTNIVVTPVYVASLFNDTNGIRNFFQNNSYGKTDLNISAADVTPVYRMPSNAVWYAVGNGSRFYGAEMQTSAYAAAALNYDLNQYDLICLTHSYLGNVATNSLMKFAGQASIGGKYSFINGAFDFGVVAHEIGHNYGVFHANRWQPPNGTVIGTETDLLANFYNGAMTGVSIEYGDGSDVMAASDNPGGGAIGSTCHFNHWLKNILQWIPDSAVQTVTAPGIYRVYRADTAAADLVNHKLALKVARDIRRDYWIGYRRLETNGVNLANGATIEFGYHENRASDLLVCNGSTATFTNAALLVGQSLTDTNAGLTFTTVAQGGVAPDEYVDMQVAMQPRVSFATNFAVGWVWEGTASVTVDRLGGSSGTTTVHYSCSDSNAVAGVHYTPISGTLSWADGDTTSRTLTIPILPFSATNGERVFTVSLTNIVNGVIINPGSCVVALRHPGNAGLAYQADTMSRGIYSIAAQPDGKLIVGGWFTSYGNAVGLDNSAGYIGRLLPDGHRDYSFKSTPGANNYVQAVRRQPDGKILVGGLFTNFHGVAISHIARLMEDGSLDPTFNPPQFHYPQESATTILDITVQPDGKILVAGAFTQIVAGGTTYPTKGGARLLPDGTLDYAYTLPSGWYSTYGLYKILLDNFTNGNPNEWGYYAVGAQYAYNFNLSRSEQEGITRHHSDGTLDTNFNCGLGANNWVRCVAQQPDGKLVVGGDFTTFNGNAHMHIARLNRDGSEDTNFNANINGPIVFAIVAQPDGKLVVGGYFSTVNGVAQQNLIRLNADGSLDSSWDNGLGAYNGTSQSVESLEMLPDGRVMVSINNSGSIRNASVSPYYSQYAVATTCPLYTGLTNLPGQATFASPGYVSIPSLAINIPVQRAGGASGRVQMDYGTQDGTAMGGVDYQPAKGTLTWNDGDMAPKNITVICNPAALAGRMFRLNLGVPRTLFAGNLQQVNLMIATNITYALWRSVKFSATQQADQSISGINAQPAGDGVPNLLKYAYDLDPLTPAIAHLPAAEFAGDHLRLQFNRDPLRSDLTYEVQASDDLGLWAAIARST
ncbi:MAG TPA: Calx-beta domain-containing protein, partial [Verrucomicrobiae bacterium]